MVDSQRRESRPWTIVARSDRGRVRERMEDAFAVDMDVSWAGRRVHAVGVFDGLGGEPRGREAALAASRRLRGLLEAGTGADNLLVELGLTVGETGGATTGVIALLPADPARPRVELWAVGDSAAYGTHPGDWRLLLPRDGAAGNVVTDYLGNAALRGHRASFDVPSGGTLVLCTDGVDGVIDASHIRSLADARASSLEGAAGDIFREVWARGAPDNATLVVVRRA